MHRVQLTPELQTSLDVASDKYHTDGIHFEYAKSHIWVLLNYGMSWIPTQQFGSLEEAMTWADNIIAKRKAEEAEFERAGG